MRTLADLHAIISAKALVNPISVVAIQAQEVLAIVAASKDAVAALPDDAKAKVVWNVFDSQKKHTPDEVLGVQSGHLLALTSLVLGAATGPTPTAAKNNPTGGLLSGTIPSVIEPPKTPAPKTDAPAASDIEPPKTPAPKTDAPAASEKK